MMMMITMGMALRSTLPGHPPNKKTCDLILGMSCGLWVFLAKDHYITCVFCSLGNHTQVLCEEVPCGHVT
jgi:hypothetical protein